MVQFIIIIIVTIVLIIINTLAELVGEVAAAPADPRAGFTAC